MATKKKSVVAIVSKAKRPQQAARKTPFSLAEIRAINSVKDRTAAGGNALFCSPAFEGLGAYEAEFLTVCQAIYREEYGSDTPGEELIGDLILGISHRPLTLEDMKRSFEVAEENWGYMNQSVWKIASEYPAIVFGNGDPGVARAVLIKMLAAVSVAKTEAVVG